MLLTFSLHVTKKIKFPVRKIHCVKYEEAIAKQLFLNLVEGNASESIFQVNTQIAKGFIYFNLKNMVPQVFT